MSYVLLGMTVRNRSREPQILRLRTSAGILISIFEVPPHDLPNRLIWNITGPFMPSSPEKFQVTKERGSRKLFVRLYQKKAITAKEFEAVEKELQS